VPDHGALFWGRSRNRAWSPPTSSSLADEKHVGSLLLRSSVRDFPTLAASLLLEYKRRFSR
jgi:hypothetical protein